MLWTERAARAAPFGIKDAHAFAPVEALDRDAAAAVPARTTPSTSKTKTKT